jgi:5-methylthioadenosine/S-adenosylhomocysteine deaminase
VSGTCVILGATPLDPDNPSQVRPPVDIVVEDGVISGIRPAGEDGAVMPAPGAEVIDAHGWSAMPGLVNAHVHSSGAFNRGLVDNLPLELFMLYELPPFDFGPFAPELYRARVLFGTLGMVRRGVTSVLDDPIYAPAPTPETIDAVMRAYEELGVRATVTIYQPDKAEHEWFPFLSDLLESDILARFESERPPPAAEIISTYRDFIGRSQRRRRRTSSLRRLAVCASARDRGVTCWACTNWPSSTTYRLFSTFTSPRCSG